MGTILLAAGFALALATAVQAHVPNGLPVAGLHQHAHADVVQVKKGKVQYKWKDSGCQYQFKADHKGIKEKYKCK